MSFDAISRRIEGLLSDPEVQRARTEHETSRARIAAKADETRHREDIERAGIPSVFARVVASDMEPTEALAALSDLGTGVVVLSGVPGCGKSVAACSWLYDGLKGEPQSMRSSLFVTAARLARWERYSDAEMNRLLRAPRLVLDDIGTEYADAKGNFLAIFDEVISDRAANERPLVITTNLTGEAFKQRYDERISQRIRESGQFVSLKAGSMRKRLADKTEAKS